MLTEYNKYKIFISFIEQLQQLHQTPKNMYYISTKTKTFLHLTTFFNYFLFVKSHEIFIKPVKKMTFGQNHYLFCLS